MRRFTALFLLSLCLVSSPCAPAVAGDEGESPRDRAVREVGDLSSTWIALLAEQEQIKEQIASTVGTTENRITTVSLAIAVLEEPYNEAGYTTYQRQAQALEERVTDLRALLDGDALPQEPGQTRADLLALLDRALQEYDQFTTLRDASEIEAQAERTNRCEQFKEELKQLQEIVDHDSRPLVSALNGLVDRASDRGDELARAMQPFGLLGEETGLGIQAVQFSGMPLQLGQVRVQWTDRRGRDVAAATLVLRPQPDRYETPPDILGRFHARAVSEGRVEASVGIFRVEFETSAEGIVDEPEVIGLLVELFDLQALGDIYPRQENGSLN